MSRNAPSHGLQAEIGSLERVRRFDRQTTLERLIAYLVHGLGSPLNVIEGRAVMMGSSPLVEAEVRKNAHIIAEQSSRIVRFLREVVASARRDPGQSATTVDAMSEPTTDLSKITRDAVTMFAPMAHAQGVSISLQGENGAAPVRGSAETLLVALTHVLENGIHATPEGGILTVRLREEPVPEEGHEPDGARVPYFSVEVDDDGPGIEPDLLPRLFKPFATTRHDRQAAGLGLFVAQSIAQEHGGWLEAVNKDGKGARFTLHLPQEHPNAE